MAEGTIAKKITSETKRRADDVSRMIALLPEKEQEKILFLVQGISIATVSRDDNANYMRTKPQ